MTLEISVHSPSDTEHFFDDHKMGDCYPFNSEGELSVKDAVELEHYQIESYYSHVLEKPYDEAHRMPRKKDRMEWGGGL